MLSERLIELGIELPENITPLGAYQPCKQAGNLLYTSALLPVRGGEIMARGAVDAEVSIEDAGLCAQQIVMNALSAARAQLADINKIKGCIKVAGYIACSEGFFEHPKVMNYASNLLIDLLGDSGRHVRSVIGVCNLPLNSPVAIEFVFELY